MKRSKYSARVFVCMRAGDRLCWFSDKVYGDETVTDMMWLRGHFLFFCLNEKSASRSSQTGHCWLIMLYWFIFMCCCVADHFSLCRAAEQGEHKKFQHLFYFSYKRKRGPGVQNKSCVATEMTLLRYLLYWAALSFKNRLPSLLLLCVCCLMFDSLEYIYTVGSVCRRG